MRYLAIAAAVLLTGCAGLGTQLDAGIGSMTVPQAIEMLGPPSYQYQDPQTGELLLGWAQNIVLGQQTPLFGAYPGAAIVTQQTNWTLLWFRNGVLQRWQQVNR